MDLQWRLLDDKPCCEQSHSLVSQSKNWTDSCQLAALEESQLYENQTETRILAQNQMICIATVKQEQA